MRRSEAVRMGPFIQEAQHRPGPGKGALQPITGAFGLVTPLTSLLPVLLFFQAAVTKVEMTFLRPVLSKSTVSLLPSENTTLP